MNKTILSLIVLAALVAPAASVTAGGPPDPNDLKDAVNPDPIGPPDPEDLPGPGEIISFWGLVCPYDDVEPCLGYFLICPGGPLCDPPRLADLVEPVLDALQDAVKA